MMRERRQAHLLTQYVEQLKQDPTALPPKGLKPETASFARRLLKSQDTRKSRMWGNILSQVNQRDIGHQAVSTPIATDKQVTQSMPPTPYAKARPIQRHTNRMALPITLIAAMIMLVVGVVVMFALSTLPDDSQNMPLAAQDDPSPTVPTQIPTALPGTSGIVISNIVGAGELQDEGIIVGNIVGEATDLSAWTLSDANGNIYIFPEARTLSGDDSITVFTTSNINNADALFWGLESALFADSANTITLTDANGVVQSVYAQGTLPEFGVVPTMPPTVPPSSPDTSTLATSVSLCIVESSDTPAVVFEQPESDQQIALLGEGMTANVYMQIVTSSDIQWYFIEIAGDAGDDLVSGWVLADNVQSVDEPCPASHIQVLPIRTTAIPPTASPISP